MGRKKPSKPTQAPAPQNQTLTIEEALGRAYAHWNAGQAPQAEMLCQRVLAVWPGQADALHLLGVMAHAFGNHDLAIQHLRQACTTPRAPGLYFSNLAEMCRQKGLLEEAEQAAQRATTLSPDLVGAWNNLGIILQEMGQYEEGAACLERVTALEPHNAEAHNNLANTWFRMGRLDRARTHYDQALSLHPNYAEAHSNLAHLLHDLGRYDEAAASARRAIDINPQLVDAYLNRAEVDLTRQDHAGALRWLDALLGFAPRHPAALSARAKALKMDGRLDEALMAAEAAVAGAPHSANAHNTLGEVRQRLGRIEEALASFEKAASLPGTEREAAQANRGSLLMEIGRKDEALAVFDQLVETNPRCVSGWISRAEMKKFAAGDPDIARMEALLASEGGASFNDRMALHFALGKAYLDHGDSARAFRHLDEGNRMKRGTFAFDVAATAQWMEGIATSFTPAVLKKFTKAGDPSDMPVFVVGMPR
ncbi:MAG TPA: tetratricopeptide repeat protein [Stellaceae bacterium]|nr:tetratricopeptide repeat protein [Stellaceae bacterium]